MQHLDANGAELHVGDTVRWLGREGTVLILEDWHTAPVIYAEGLGYWGDCQALHASSVVKV